MRFSSRKFLGVCAAAGLMCASLAHAQSDGNAPRKPITPTTVKTVGGWDVRCYPVQTPAPCEMWEAVAFKGTQQLAASISIVYIPASDGYAVQLVLPLGIDFAKGIRLNAGSYTSEALHFERCERVGCIIAIREGNATVGALRNQPNVKLDITWFHGKAMNITVPLKGFDEARAALVDVAKQKAVTPKTDDTAAPSPSP